MSLILTILLLGLCEFYSFAPKLQWQRPNVSRALKGFFVFLFLWSLSFLVAGAVNDWLRDLGIRVRGDALFDFLVMCVMLTVVHLQFSRVFFKASAKIRRLNWVSLIFILSWLGGAYYLAIQKPSEIAIYTERQFQSLVEQGLSGDAIISRIQFTFWLAISPWLVSGVIYFAALIWLGWKAEKIVRENSILPPVNQVTQ